MSDNAPMDVDYVAKLARIDLTEEEKSTYQRQLGDVLKYFDKLQELDVEGVEPTAHAFPRYNVWDEDESKPGFSAGQALQNAPQSRQDQVVVPKVIEG